MIALAIRATRRRPIWSANELDFAGRLVAVAEAEVANEVHDLLLAPSQLEQGVEELAQTLEALLWFEATGEELALQIEKLTAGSKPDLNKADIVGGRRDRGDLGVHRTLDGRVLLEVLGERSSELLARLARVAVLLGAPHRRLKGLGRHHLLGLAVLTDRINLRHPFRAGRVGACAGSANRKRDRDDRGRDQLHTIPVAPVTQYVAPRRVPSSRSLSPRASICS